MLGYEWDSLVRSLRDGFGRLFNPMPSRSDVVTASRGLAGIGAGIDDASGRAVIRCLCDCGVMTELLLVPSDPVTGQPYDMPDLAGAVRPQEIAYTCDSCTSPHWLIIGPADAPDT
jgi:hypothetical protein